MREPHHCVLAVSLVQSNSLEFHSFRMLHPCVRDCAMAADACCLVQVKGGMKFAMKLGELMKGQQMAKL